MTTCIENYHGSIVTMNNHVYPDGFAVRLKPGGRLRHFHKREEARAYIDSLRTTQAKALAQPPPEDLP